MNHLKYLIYKTKMSLFNMNHYINVFQPLFKRKTLLYLTNFAKHQEKISNTSELFRRKSQNKQLLFEVS